MKPIFRSASWILLAASASAQALRLADLRRMVPYEERLLERAVAADADGDGDLDLIGSGAYYANDGHGRFAALPETGFRLLPGYVPGWDYRWDVAVGDVDGDGHVDALVHTIVFRGDGTGRFVQTDPPLLPNVLTATFWNALADMDGDGDLDALTFRKDGTIHVFDNEGGVLTATSIA